MLFLVSILWN